MLRAMIALLLVLSLAGSAASAEGFTRILSNGSLDNLALTKYLVEDDVEDDALFGDDDLALQDRPERAALLTITAGGDAVVGIRELWWNRSDALPAYLAEYGMGWPFGGLQEVFAQDDLTYINLECTLKPEKTGEVTNKEFRFRGLPEYVLALTGSSVELLNIANNHYVDYGEAGMLSTRQSLERAGLAYSGYGYAYVWQQGGWRIGFAGCRETEYKLDPTVITREAEELRRLGCDVVIYACHWGREYNTRHNEAQLEMAQVAAAAGVDIIIGTHPHVVQGIDQVDGTVVLWSLGNLMFGGTINMQTFDGTLAQLQLHFDKQGYAGVTVTYLPVLTSSIAATGRNDYHPVLAEGADYNRILRKIQYDSTVDVSQPVFFPARGR